MLLCGLLVYSAAAPFWQHLFETHAGNYQATAGFGLIAAVKIILAASCFSLAWVEEISLPFTHVIDTVYGQAPDSSKPPLDLSQADKYLRQGLISAAEREHRRLLDYYPHALPVWQSLISLTRTHYDESALSTLLHEAKHHFLLHPKKYHALNS